MSKLNISISLPDDLDENISEMINTVATAATEEAKTDPLLQSTLQFLTALNIELKYEESKSNSPSN